MKALGPSRSYSPHPVITSPKSNSPDKTPAVAVAAQQKILRNVFAGQDHRRLSSGISGAASRSSSSSPSRNFCGNPRRSCRARHPSICRAHERSQPGSIRASAPTGARCTSAMVAPISASTRSLSLFRQRRPRFRAEHARKPRDDEIRPPVALAFDDDFGDRDAKPAAKRRQRAALRNELATKQRRKIFRMSFSSRPTTRLVPVEKTCGAALARPWPRAISRADRQPLRRVGAPGAEGS